MTVARRTLIASGALPAAIGVLLGGPPLRSAEDAPWTVRDLAQKVQLSAEPGHPFRYNQGTGPYGSPTLNLLERRRAFFPGEKVRITFRLPREAKLEAPLEARAVFALQDLDGMKVQDAGEATLKAAASAGAGTFRWTGPDAKDGPHFLAAHFLDADGQPPGTRRETLCLNPEHPPLP